MLGRAGRGRCWPCYTRAMTGGLRPLVGVGVVFVRRGEIFLARRRGELGRAVLGARPEGTWNSARRWRTAPAGRHGRSSAWRSGELRYLCAGNIVAYGRHYVDFEFLGEIGEQEPELLEPEAFDGSGWFPLRLPAGAAVRGDAVRDRQPADGAAVLSVRTSRTIPSTGSGQASRTGLSPR